MNGKLPRNLFFFTSILFAPITFVCNLLIGIIVSESSFLKIGGMFLILMISFIISAFVIVLRNEPPKFIQIKILSYSAGIYTLISMILNIFVQIIANTIYSHPNKLWNVFSVIITLAFSIIISTLIIYFKPKSISVLLITYFFVIGIFYYLLTITFGGLGNGNRIIITLSIYIASFALISLIYLLIKAKKAKNQRDSMPYQKQF